LTPRYASDMPYRKQRRRRQKERRHQYEFVYVDEEGRELAVEEEGSQPDPPRRDGKRDSKREPRKGRDARPGRTVQPPSWNRVGKRALIFFPLIFLAFSFVNSKQALGTRVLVTLVYTAFFVPFMYLMDRAMYRSYLKRTGQAPPRRASGR
jgi:Flp pilus assembly protein TadB